MSEICISLCPESVKEALKELKEGEKIGDLTELRLDYIKDINRENLEGILSKKTKPVIITNRNKKEGGHFAGSEEERLCILKRAMELKADFIDIEISSGHEVISEMIRDKKETRIICSYHNYKETPDIKDLEDIYEKIRSFNPDLVKIATFAKSVNDNFKVFTLLKNKKDLITLCMGIRGQISRILAQKFGSPLTYACLREDKSTADGQIGAKDLIDIYNFHSINIDTKILGVIGSYAENSLSKFIHNENFKKEGLNYIYIPFKTEPEELEGFMINFRKFNFHGSAVTIPHKVEIMKYLDCIEERTQKIGAVNTVVNDKEKLKGYNTDYQGAIRALEEKVRLKGKRALILGAGGAARAIGYGLKEKETEIIIANRREEKARKLAGELNVKYCSLNNIDKELYDIIINTTSVGMYPDAGRSVIEKKYLRGKTVFDIVYRPMVTQMIKDGKSVGAAIVEGYIMLLYQGVEQYKLWTGIMPDEKVAKKILFEQLKK